MQVNSMRDSPAPYHDDETQQNRNSANPNASVAAPAAAQALRPGTREDKVSVTDVNPVSVPAATQAQFENYYMRSKFLRQNMSPGFQTQAANYIRDTIKKNTGLEIDPDKTSVNAFNGAQALQDGNDGITGFQHNRGDLRESMTLTDFILRNGNDGWRAATSGELNIHYGLYKEGADAKTYGAKNEVPLLPSDLRKMFGDGGLEKQLAGNQASFWSNSQSTWQMLAKTEFAGLAKAAVLNRQLSRQGYELAMKGGASNVPRDGAAKLMHVATDSKPDPSVQVRRFDINGYAATDILRFTGQDGHEVLYVPGARQPFYEFSGEDQLKDWVREQARDPAARQELASHFSVYDRSQGGWGPFSASGVNEGLDKLASGAWDGGSIDLGKETVTGDVFRDMAERMRQRDRDDLAQVSGNSERRQIWLDDLKKSDSALFTRPIDRALAAGDFAASVGAEGGKRFEDAAGMDLGLMLLFGPSVKPVPPTAARAQPPAAATAADAGVSIRQKDFSVPEATPRNVPEAINEINARMQAIAGRNNVTQSNSLKDLQKTRYGEEHKVGLARTRNALEEVQRRLGAANENLHDPAQKNLILQNLARSLGTQDENALSQAYARLRNMVTEAHDRFDAFRDNDYRNITFFHRTDDTQPVPEDAKNNPVASFSNPKDPNRLVVNLDAPDKGRYSMSESQASGKYNVELVDSLMHEMTRLAGHTQALVKVRQEETKNGFSLGPAVTALDQFMTGKPGDAVARQVLGKAADVPDDASVVKILGMPKDGPVTDDMRTRARFRYNGLSQKDREGMAGSMNWTYSDKDREGVRNRIRQDDVLRADLMTSDADTAALLLRDIADHRAHDAPVPDAVAPRRYTYGVEDLAGTLHTFSTQAEADDYAAGALKRGLVSGLKNPLGSVMKIGGRVAGEPPEKNNRLYEIGDNLIGEGAAALAKEAGAPQPARDALKQVGGAAEYAVPYVGQARFYGGLAGRLIEGEAPTATDMANIGMDMKHLANGAPQPTARPNPSRGRGKTPSSAPGREVKQGKTSSNARQPPVRFKAGGGADALQIPAKSVLKFDPSKHFRHVPKGVSDGLSVEAVKRMDSQGGDLGNAVRSIKRDLKLPGPARDAVAGTIVDQQKRPSLDNLKNYRSASSKNYTGDREGAVKAMEKDARNLGKDDVGVLKMQVVDKNGKVKVSPVLVEKNVGNRKYEIYDPRNGVFTYKTAESSAKALDDYLNTAYRKQGELRPSSFTDYKPNASASAPKTQPFFNPPTKLPDGRVGYPAGPIRPPRLPPEGWGQPGTSGMGGGGAPYVSAERRIAIGEHIDTHPGESDAAVAYQFGVRPEDVANVRDERGATRGGRQPLTQTTRNAIVKDIRDNPGLTDLAVARRHGVAASTVNGVRRAAGLPAANPRVVLTEAQRTGVVNYFLAHPTAVLADVATATGVRRRSVRTVLATDPRLEPVIEARRAAQLPGRVWLKPPRTQAGGHDEQPPAAYPGAQPGAGAAAWPSTSTAEANRSLLPSPRREQAIDELMDQLDEAGMAAVDNERVLEWMVDNLSDEQLEAVERLPDDEFDRALKSILAKLPGASRPVPPGAQAVPAAGPVQPVLSAPRSPQPGPSGQGRMPDEPQGELSTGRQPAIDLLESDVDRMAMGDADRESVIEWMIGHLSGDQLQAILDLPQERFEQEVNNIRLRLDGGDGSGASGRG